MHDCVIYNGKNKPKDGHRLSVITFKTPGAKVDPKSPDYDPNYKRPEARCISVPKLEMSCTPQILKDALQQALEDLQDAKIRQLVVAELEQGKNVITILDVQIGFEALAEFAALEAANGKLNKDAIDEWFEADVANQLTLALANAMKLPDNPAPEQEKTLAAAVTMYKDVFKTLAAPKAGLSPAIAKQMKKALEHAENKESRVFKALQAKVVQHLEAKDPELVGL
jgi:hypothetical protein